MWFFLMGSAIQNEICARIYAKTQAKWHWIGYRFESAPLSRKVENGKAF
ncbi:hypothetical protein CAter282_1118 [Collimonas arenae]|uniref:Uncharacterized protein n=1 Tax=Collimonas arenae TaxID=279058 RepID=A0A127QH33_9BURK|nr:hypothetical protein CAter10_1214 [Collimonas arenae]AMP08912.1 hypothetical protein CAter282_1118 [Collimonas arenae]